MQPDPRTSEDREMERGDTKPLQDRDPVPRMPHERDESSDSQSLDSQPSVDVTRQGYEDLKHGLVDTDRGPDMDKRTLNRVPPDAPDPNQKD